MATIVPWPGISRGTRGDRSDAARVGEADVGARVGVGRQRVVARARDQLVVARDEVGKLELASRPADHRHDERARAVLALDVDRQPEADRAGHDALRLAVLLGERVAHHRHVARGLHDRPGDQVGEGELAGRRP